MEPTSLRARRESAGLTIESLAHAAHTSASTIRRIESGGSARASTRRRLEDALTSLVGVAESTGASDDGALLVLRAYERGGEDVRRTLCGVARLALFHAGHDGGAGRAA